MCEIDQELRTKLRAAFDALESLGAYCTPDKGFAPQSIAIENAIDELVDNLLEVVGHCDGCTAIILVGDQGHRCHDGEAHLCAACAYTWGEVKEQWDKDEHGGDETDHARFVTAYDAHIAAGGKPTDKMLRTM